MTTTRELLSNACCILRRTAYEDNTPITTSEVVVMEGKSGVTFRIYCTTQGGSFQLYTKDSQGTEFAEGAAQACTAPACTLKTLAYRPGRPIYGKFTPTDDDEGIVEIWAESYG